MNALKKKVSLVLCALLCVQLLAFTAGARPANADPAPQSVKVTFDDPILNEGITTWAGDGGGANTVSLGGQTGLQTNPAGGVSYIYGNVDDSFINGGTNEVQIAVDYYDAAESSGGKWKITYDAAAMPWKDSTNVELTGSNTWKTYTFTLEDAKFANESNGADFRIETTAPVTFRSIAVTKVVPEMTQAKVTFDDPVLDEGITTWIGDGGGASTVTLGGQTGLQTNPESGASYIYSNVDDNFMNGGTNAVQVAVEYYDSEAPDGGKWELAYDAADTPWKYLSGIELTGTNTWKTYAFTLEDAKFAGESNGADFRIGTTVPVAFRSITVTKYEAPPVLQNAKVTFDNPILSEGITTWTGDGGSASFVTLGDQTGLQTDPSNGASYIYGNVSDSYMNGGKNAVQIDVVYFDASIPGGGKWELAYDSVDTPWAYLKGIQLTGSNTWKTYTFTLEDAKFGNESNGADFRIGTTATIAFRSINVTKLARVKIEASTARAGNVFYAGDSAAFGLTLSNETADGTFGVTYKVLDYNNAVVLQNSFTEPIAQGEATNKPIELGVLPRGAYKLAIEVANGDGTPSAHEEYRFSVIQDLSGRELTIDNFGVGAHFSQSKGNPDLLLPLMKQAGIQSVRDEYYWGNIEQQPGVFDFSGGDAYVNKIVAAGLDPLIVLDYGNDLYTQGIVDTPEERSAFANYAFKVAEHLKGKVSHFEVWNEYNGGGGGSADQYFELLKSTYAAVKAANPDAVVVGGGVLGYDSTFLKRVIDLGGYDYMDALSMHPYAGANNPEQQGVFGFSENITAYIATKTAKYIPIWITETGWPTQYALNGGVSESRQAAYISQLYILNHANPGKFERIFIYDFQNDGTNPAEGEHNFGLVSLEAGGASKPSYVALNAASDLLNGKTFEQLYNSFPSAPDLRIAKFKNDGDGGPDVLAIWSNGGEQSVSLNVGTTGETTVTDAFGKDSSFATVNGAISLTASELPQYLVGHFAEDPVVGVPYFSSADALVNVVPGEDVELKINRSAEGQSLSGTYDVSLPDGWSVVSGQNFSAGSNQDTITIHVSAHSVQDSNIVTIHPHNEEGRVLGEAVVHSKTVDSFVVETYPVEKTSGDGWEFAVRLVNNYSFASIPAGTVTISEPADSAGMQSFDAIAPKSERVLYFPAPMLAGGWTTHFNVKVERSDGYSKTIEKAVSSLTAVKKAADETIVIDGTIQDDEWKNAMTYTLDKAEQTKNFNETSPWGGASDLSATGKVKWDDDYLYMAFSVVDDTHYQANTPDFAWQADSVQVSIDPGRAAGYNSIGHHQLLFALNSQTGESMKAVSNSDVAELKSGLLQNSPVKIVRDEAHKRTNYEIALKWSEILPASRIPAAERLTDIGFSMLVNDSEGAQRRGWIEYMSGIGFQKDPSLFGDLILTDRNQITIPEVEQPGGGEDPYMLPPKAGNFVPQTELSVQSVSSQHPSGPPENVLDSDLRTNWWVSWDDPPRPHFIVLDLGKSYNVSSIWYRTQMDYDGGMIYRYNVYVGDSPDQLVKVVDDAEAPTVTVDDPESTIGEYALQLPSAYSGRYVKLEVTNSKYDDLRISELNVGFDPSNNDNGNGNGNGNGYGNGNANSAGEGKQQIAVDSAAWTKALADAVQESGSDLKVVRFTVDAESETGEYEVKLPAEAFANTQGPVTIEIATPVGNVRLPSDMFQGTGISGNVSINLAAADKSALPANAAQLIGDHPVIELTVKSGDQVVAWNNPNTPVTVSVPYEPGVGDAGKADPEHIVVWYIGENGEVTPVPNGKYDAESGQITFKTTHFSTYAIAYANKTFTDIANLSWARHSVEVLASKGIVNGVSDSAFEPNGWITRADFLVMLMRTLEFNGHEGEGFADVPAGAYYERAVRVAQSLGIVQGSGDGRFNPKASISRVDMMVMTQKALKAAKLIADSEDEAPLGFKDADQVPAYAAASVSALVHLDLVHGDGERIAPAAPSTRAQAAVLLYNLYKRFV